MLVLSRKVGEEIIIGDNIRVTVVAVRPNVVRLGFTAPGNVPIFRSEICPARDTLEIDCDVRQPAVAAR